MRRLTHETRTRCMGLFSLALAGALAGTAVADTRVDLPSPQDLMNKHIEAVGGKDLIKKFKSRKMTGTISIAAMGMEGTLTMLSAAPNKMLMVMNLEGMGETVQGYNGKVGWSMNDMQGSMILEDEMLEQVARESQFYSELTYADTYETLETVEEVTFAGKSAYKVRQVTKSEDESFSFFDKESGLLLGNESIAASQMGEVPVTAILADYKEFDGLKLPTSNTIEQMGMEIVMVIEKVEHDTVDDEAFATPEEIKSLIKASKDDDSKHDGDHDDHDGADHDDHDDDDGR